MFKTNFSNARDIKYSAWEKRLISTDNFNQS